MGGIEIGGIKIAIIHGKDEKIVNALAKSGEYNVVIRGHTHKPDIRKIGTVIIINPGEACGYLSDKRTIAIFDKES